MKNIFSHHKKIISGVLIFLIVFPMLSTPKEARAQAAVLDAANLKANAADALANTKSLPETIISAIKTTVTAINTNWPVVRDKVVKPLIILAMRIIIREMKRMALNYIATGNAGKPQFVTNFQLDAKQVAENAARSYLSQLTGVNFCNFFPSPQQSLYSLNFQFQLECSITNNAYARYLADPASVTDVERLLAMDPSTDFLQTLINTQQQKAQSVAQAGIARAAQISSGFIGDTVKSVFKPSEAAIKRDLDVRKEAARQVAMGEAASGLRTDQEAANAFNAAFEKARQNCLQSVTAGSPGVDCNSNAQQDRFAAEGERAEKEFLAEFSGPISDTKKLLEIGDAAAKAVTERAPEPTFIDNIKTPGQAVAGLLNNATMQDFMGPTVAKDFGEAIIQIVDTAFQVMISKGLNKAFGH